MVGGDDPYYLKFLGQTDIIASETPIFNLYLLVAPQL